MQAGLAARARHVCAGVLGAWAARAQRSRMQQRGLARLQQRQAAHLLQHHLRTWHAVVVEVRCARARVCAWVRVRVRQCCCCTRGCLSPCEVQPQAGAGC